MLKVSSVPGNNLPIATSEKNHLLSLVWALREQLDDLSCQNELLQRQRNQLGAKLKQMERSSAVYQRILSSQRNSFQCLFTYLLAFIVIWIRQRLYAKALAHHILRNRLSIKALSSPKPCIDVKEEDSDDDDILTSQPDMQRMEDPSENVSLLATDVTEHFEYATEAGNESFIIDIAVLDKVQQLRKQLEDFQAILKSNENSVLQSPSKNIPPKEKQPEYLKHRRTNSKNIRHSLTRTKDGKGPPEILPSAEEPPP